MTGAGNDTRLVGKVVAVTGAARGLGAEIARHCARAGARVAVCDIAREDGRRTAAEIVRAGGDARYFELDVADEGAWQRALVELKDAFGALHVLVNNAGIIARSPLATLSVADWRRVIEINLTGPFIGTKLTAPLIRDAGGGSIINISSVAGFAGHPDCAYGASKWGLRGLTKSAALNFAGWGVRVNSVHPSMVLTPLQDTAPPGYIDAAYAAIPLGRPATPEEVARVVVFTCLGRCSLHDRVRGAGGWRTDRCRYGAHARPDAKDACRKTRERLRGASLHVALGTSLAARPVECGNVR